MRIIAAADVDTNSLLYVGVPEMTGATVFVKTIRISWTHPSVLFIILCSYALL